MNTDGKIRLGVLGASRIAKKSGIPAIIASDEAELVMIGSRSAESAAACAAEFGCAAFGTYNDVVANPAIDAVYISLPNSLHEEWTMRAAQAGKHVWCEKPAGLSFASAERMVAACEENGVRLLEGFMFLWHPQHALVRQLIEDGAIGELRSFSGTFSLPMPAEGNIRLDASLGGGVLNDAGTYPLRASRMIFDDEPTSISCTLAIDSVTRVDTNAEVTLSYPNGRIAIARAIYGGEYISTYEVIGSSGRIWLERAYAVPADRAVKVFLENSAGIREFDISPIDQFKLMIDGFCREIRLGSSGERRYENDLLMQARALEASHASHKTHRLVGLSGM